MNSPYPTGNPGCTVFHVEQENSEQDAIVREAVEKFLTAELLRTQALREYRRLRQEAVLTLLRGRSSRQVAALLGVSHTVVSKIANSGEVIP